MFAVERIEQIKQFLRKNKQAEVSTLSKMLSVTAVTVRHDLRCLEEESFLIRTHGGAVLNESEKHTSREWHSLKHEQLAMEQIAHLAVSIIEDGEIILLTGGRINREIARLLYEKNDLTVVTNDLYIGFSVVQAFKHKVILLGGKMDQETQIVCDSLTKENFNQIFVSSAFLEMDGFNMKTGFSVSSTEKASFFYQVLENADKQIAVFLSEQTGKTALSKIGSANIADVIITDVGLSEEYRSYFLNNHIPLMLSHY